jgi:propionyl-CoA synthetase
MTYAEFYRRSVDEPEAFWGEQARLIDWRTPPQRILDNDKSPFTRWFVGGTTNLCHNAIDRHLKDRPNQAALIHVSTETGREETYTFSCTTRCSARPRRSAASVWAGATGS